MTTHDPNLDAPEAEPAPPPGVRSMALVRWVFVAAMALVATGSVLWYFGLAPSLAGAASEAGGKLYYCPMHPQIVQDHPGECPICSMTLVPKPEGPVKPSATMQPATTGDAGAAGPGKYWCPMHPHVTSDDPNAKCDLCGGMKLMPKPPAGAASEPVPGLVPMDIPTERVQKIGIRTAPVVRESLVNDLRTVGVVEADERRLVQISTRSSGWIENLFAAETGQPVKRGQALATVYSPDVLQAQQELLTALRWSDSGTHGAGRAQHGELASPQGLVSDARRRLELLGIGPQEIESIVKNRKAERALAIRSPVDGYVIGKHVVVGMTVSPGMPLFEVANLSSVWVIAEVYESDVKRVRVGQPARFEVASYPGEVFTGKVQFVHPTVDPSSRTLRLRLELKNRPGPGGLKLRPGMYGNVSLDLPATSGLMAPAEAVVDTGDLQYVFVAIEGGRFEPRRVKLGARAGEKFEIISGLAEGEVVVTTANFLLDSESRLRSAIEGQTAKTAPAPGGAAPAPAQVSTCDTDIDKQKYPEKYQACRACETQHRGMGTMEEDCKKAIAKPWR